MIVDGKKHSIDLARSINLIKPLTLAVVMVGDDPVVEKYVSHKETFANLVGIKVERFCYEVTISKEELITEINRLNNDSSINGIIVQLPLPFDEVEVLSVIDPNKDPDALSPNPKVLSPVVRAIDYIINQYQIDLAGEILVVGQGKLVGRPVSLWLAQQGLSVAVAKQGDNLIDLTKRADLIISGVGKPNLITKEMIKEGVAIIDAATSEASGKLVGDVHPDCAEKSSVFTPVPGGLGPITVAMLFKNLVDLSLKS